MLFIVILFERKSPQLWLAQLPGAPGQGSLHASGGYPSQPDLIPPSLDVTLCGRAEELCTRASAPTPVTHFSLLFLGYKWYTCNTTPQDAGSDKTLGLGTPKSGNGPSCSPELLSVPVPCSGCPAPAIHGLPPWWCQ